MARRDSDVPAEPLVPVAAIEVRTGLVDEIVWQKLGALGWKAQQNWDGSWAVTWSQAKEFVDRIEAEKVGYDEAERQRREAQMDDELRGRRQYADAYEAAKERGERRVRGGVEVTAPGAEKPWADGGEDE